MASPSRPAAVRATRVARDAGLRAVQPARLAQPWTMASRGAHLLLLGLFYVLPPHSHALTVDDVDPRGRLIRFAQDAQSREPEPPEWAKDALPPGASQRTPKRVPLRVVS